jgi:hypothetical protein
MPDGTVRHEYDLLIAARVNRALFDSVEMHMDGEFILYYPQGHPEDNIPVFMMFFHTPQKIL